MKISIIAAMSENRVIGDNGRIPWKIKGEQKLFKELTLEKTVIMGRRTYEEIGKPLPNRKNIVISNTLSLDNGCIIAKSLEDALNIAKDDGEVFIIGGGKLYEETLPLASSIYLTIVHKYVDGDTFFPKIDNGKFYKTSEKVNIAEIPYTYYTYTSNTNN